MSSKLFESTPQLMGSGLGLGMNGLIVPLWLNSENMDYDTYGVHTTPGFTELVWSDMLFDSAPGLFDSAPGLFDAGLSPGSVPMVISGEPTGIFDQLKSDNTRRLYIGTNSQLFTTDGTTAPSDVSGSTYTGQQDAAAAVEATRWSMMNWNDWIIAANNQNAPQVYKGSAFADLGGISGIFTRCRLVAPLGPHVLYLGTDNSNNEVRWCAEGNPEALDPALYATAGQVRLTELKNGIIAAVPLGRSLAVYSLGEMQVLNYVGSWGVIGQSTTALKGAGAVSSQSVVPVGAINFGLQKNGVYQTDGNSYNLVSYPALGDWLANNINWDQQSKIWGRHNPGQSQVKWAVPLLGSNDCNAVITYSYRSQGFGVCDDALVFNVGREPGPFGAPILALRNGTVVKGDYGYEGAAGSVSRYVQTKPLDFGERTAWKHIDIVQSELRINSGSGPSLYIGAQEHPDDTISWAGPFALDGSLKQWPCNADGVLLSFKWVSTGADDDWELHGFKVFGVLDGDNI